MNDDSFLHRLDNYFRTEIVGFMEADGDAKVARVNRGLCKLLGYEHGADLIGKPVAALLHRDDRVIAQAHIERLDRAETDTCQFELRYLTKRGDTEPVLVSVQAGERNAQGRPQWYGVFIVSLAEIKAAQHSVADLTNKQSKIYRKTVETLSRAIETKDPYTAGHQTDVGTLAVQIGQRLKLSDDGLQGLYLGGVVHDIGKIGVPAQFLTKPTRLTDLEYGVIKTHSETGYHVLREIETPWPIADMAHQHHERMDGRGYPAGLSGSSILMEARVLAVADTVDSMMKPRPYRSAQGYEKTLAALHKDRGVGFDADVVDACLEIIRV